MKQLITVNDDLQEVHTKFMINDLARWAEELKMIDKELAFYHDIIFAAQNLAQSNVEETDVFDKKIAEINAQNMEITHEFQEFSNKLEGIIECDDLQCETYYVNNHTDFQQQIEKHFSDYNLFKETIFNHLRKILVK